MGELEKIGAFLQSVGYQDLGKSANEDGQFPFVTVSRETGAGGHSLAAAILALFEKQTDPALRGWKMFDQELCEALVKDPRLKVRLQAIVTEEFRSEFDDIVDSLVSGKTDQHIVARRIFSTVRVLAQLGKVVLVGRAASCVTRDLPRGVHVRLVASVQNRVHRMAGLLNIGEKSARNLIIDQDKSRRRLVDTFFNKNISDPLLYDCVINTDTVPIETAAESVLVLVKRKLGCPFARVSSGGEAARR